MYTNCNCKRKIIQKCVEALDIVGEEASLLIDQLMLVKETPQKMQWLFLSQHGQLLSNFPAFFEILGAPPLRPSIGIYVALNTKNHHSDLSENKHLGQHLTARQLYITLSQCMNSII